MPAGEACIVAPKCPVCKGVSENELILCERCRIIWNDINATPDAVIALMRREGYTVQRTVQDSLRIDRYGFNDFTVTATAGSIDHLTFEEALGDVASWLIKGKTHYAKKKEETQ